MTTSQPVVDPVETQVEHVLQGVRASGIFLVVCGLVFVGGLAADALGSRDIGRSPERAVLQTVLLSALVAVAPTHVLAWRRRARLIAEIRAECGDNGATVAVIAERRLPEWLRRARVESGAQISFALLVVMAALLGAVTGEVVLVMIPLLAAALVAAGRAALRRR